MIRLFRVNGITRHPYRASLCPSHPSLQKNKVPLQNWKFQRRAWHVSCFFDSSASAWCHRFTLSSKQGLLMPCMLLFGRQDRELAPAQAPATASNCHGIASEMEAWSEAAVAMRILRHRLWPEKFLLMENLWKNVVPFWKLLEYRNVQSGSGGLSLSKSKKGHLEAELKLIWGKRLG